MSTNHKKIVDLANWCGKKIMNFGKSVVKNTCKFLNLITENYHNFRQSLTEKTKFCQYVQK